MNLLGPSSRAVTVASDALRFGGFDQSILTRAGGLGDLGGEPQYV
jgi:hypothetical protein